MSQTISVKTKAKRGFAFKTNSKQLIADLKALQHKHGVFSIGTISTKDLPDSANPANFGLVLMRGENNVLDHVIFTDEHMASTLSSPPVDQAENITPPHSEVVTDNKLVANIEKDVQIEAAQVFPPIGENESPDEWAKRNFPNGL